MRSMTDPADTWTTLKTAAITLHELFASLTEGGFTEDQAINLLARLITTIDGPCD